MQIRGKTVLVFDIEVFHNIFHCSIKNSETNEIIKFEISSRKNQLEELVNFFKQLNKPLSWGDYYTTGTTINSKYIFCVYNNLHYDNPVINYIIEYKDKLTSEILEQKRQELEQNIYFLKVKIYHLEQLKIQLQEQEGRRKVYEKRNVRENKK